MQRDETSIERRETTRTSEARRLRASVRLLALLAGALALHAPPAAAVTHLLFAWADQATTQKYIPSPSYLHNGMGGVTYVDRLETGVYAVHFGGMRNEDFSHDPNGLAISSRHVSAYGTSSDYCVLYNASYQGVRCYDTAGAPVDTRFAVMLAGRGLETENMAAALVFASGGGTWLAQGYSGDEYVDPVVTRDGPGLYTVGFPDFAAIGTGGGNVQVTAVESSSPGEGHRCVVQAWNNEQVFVRCFDAMGAAADSRFHVTYLRETPGLERTAFAWANDASSSSYTPLPSWSYNPTGGSITAQRLGTGHYTMTWAGLAGVGAGAGQPQVTAYGGLDRRCKIASWAGSTGSVSIRCFDTGGTPVDTQYSVVWRKPLDRKLLTRGVAAATIWSPTASAYTPTLSWNPSGTESSPDPVSVTRLSTGRHSVEFQGLYRFGADGGNVQVTATQPGDRCKVEGWSDDDTVVLCFDWAGNPKDAEFSVVFLKPEASNEQLAYAWTSSGSAPVQTPDAFYAHNPSGGAISVARNSTGLYRATFTGLSSYGVDQGVPMVTAYGPGSSHCKLVYWQNDYVDVRCMAANGVLADSRFSLVWFKPDLTADGFATAYADLESTGSYAPLDDKAHNPTGLPILAERVPVLFTTQYEMSWEEFFERGLTHFDRFALVSAVGADSVSCSGEAIVPATAVVSTNCSDSNGVEALSKYTTVLFEPIALPEPALGAQLGAGLVGLVLLARARRARVSARRSAPAHASRPASFAGSGSVERRSRTSSRALSAVAADRASPKPRGRRPAPSRRRRAASAPARAAPRW